MKRLTGKIVASRIRMQDVPRPDAGIIERFQAIGCDSSLVSDALDALGLASALPATRYRPTISGKAIVGPATTVRNMPSAPDNSAVDRANTGQNGMAEMEAHNLANQGDVVVIEGVEGLSNMGGISALIAKRHGVAGAIVSGGIRDVSHSRSEDFPLWATEISPITGKWRLETVEINGPISLDGVPVRPGDLMVADDTGICVVPREFATQVIELAEAQFALEAARIKSVGQGTHVADLPGKVQP